MRRKMGLLSVDCSQLFNSAGFSERSSKYNRYLRLEKGICGLAGFSTGISTWSTDSRAATHISDIMHLMRHYRTLFHSLPSSRSESGLTVGGSYALFLRRNPNWVASPSSPAAAGT